MLLWDEAYPEGNFPFGKLYVGAFFYMEDGIPDYIAYDIIENPTPTDNLYEMTITMDPTLGSEYRVFAVLDYYQDNITGTDEPIGGYPQALPLSEDFAQPDVDFAVLSPMYVPREPCETTPSGEPRSVTIEGVANITQTWTGGDVAVYLMEAGAVGPVHYTTATPVALGGGAEAEYQLEACEDLGYVSLRGCWDRNFNGMFEPMDQYGSYISEPNQSGNPISVKYSNLAGYDLQIPLHSSGGLRLLPFMSISGKIKASGGFESITEGGTLHVAALKFRPQGSISVQDIEEVQSYDMQTFEWEELVGKSEIDYKLMAPKQTITYLWAYIDVDDNGYVNESLEPIASAVRGRQRKVSDWKHQYRRNKHGYDGHE